MNIHCVKLNMVARPTIDQSRNLLALMFEKQLSTTLKEKKPLSAQKMHSVWDGRATFFGWNPNLFVTQDPMHNFRTLGQPYLGGKPNKGERERKMMLIVLICLQCTRAAQTLRSDLSLIVKIPDLSLSFNAYI